MSSVPWVQPWANCEETWTTNPFINGEIKMKNQTVKKVLFLLLFACLCALVLCACDMGTSPTNAPGEYFTYTLLPNDTYEIKVKDNNNLPASVSLPDTYKGKPVTSIGSGGFCDCSSLTSLIIPEGVTNIETDAFRGCSALTSITIPTTVTNIGEGAFTGCPIQEATLPTTAVRYMPRNSLQTVVINGTSIGDDAFSGWSSLTSVTIGNSVTSIGNYAFRSCSSLTSVTIGNSVTSIGSDAFSGCSSLTSVTIPDGVTSLGGYAFYGCSSLTGVYITDVAAWCNISFDSMYQYPDDCCNPLYYAHNLYLNGELVTDLVIPDGVTTIGYRAFYGCSSLTSITIPDSVTSIGDAAFHSCSSLTSITIPDGVTSIGDYAFGGCSSLTSVTFENTSGWKVSRYSDMSGNTAVTVSNPATAATYLTSTYCDYYWERS